MSNRLYVGNLSFDTTETELITLFQHAGTVQSATVIADKLSGRSKGFGFVEMSSDAEAGTALEEINETMLDGRRITVDEAQAPQDRSIRGSHHRAGQSRW